MKQYRLLFLLLLITQLYFACKKEGKLIEAKGYGNINISSTTSADVGALLVEIDGKVTDTLKAPADNASIKTYTGQRKVKIYQAGKANAPIVDTVFDVKGNTANLKFLYTGDIKIIGGGSDGSTKPKPGNSLVQFINLEKSLPASVDVKVYEFYYDETGTYFADEVATLKNVTKDKFSSFLEIPPLKHGDTSIGYYYGLFNSATGEKLVDALTDFPFLYWEGNGNATPFIPNKIMSLGIAINPEYEIYTSTVIYEAQAK